MLKQFFTALLCGLAVAGQMRAQEVVVAREEKPSVVSEQAAPVSERTDSESATATRMDTQARKKKSASTVLTVEEMRMAGALAAERQKKQARVEQTNATGGPSRQATKTFEGALAEKQKKQVRLEQPSVPRPPKSQTGKSEAVDPVRPTMIESGKQEPAASDREKTEVRGGQAGVPQSANRALRKKEPIASRADSPDGDSTPTQSAPSELHLPSR